jgi:hypothetical protein
MTAFSKKLFSRFIRRGVEYPAPWGGSISTSDDGGVETSPVQNEKSPQDFFFSTEDTPLLAGFFIFRLAGGSVSFFMGLPQKAARLPPDRLFSRFRRGYTAGYLPPQALIRALSCSCM